MKKSHCGLNESMNFNPVGRLAKHGVRTVSYTHLDVYKRQDVSGSIRLFSDVMKRLEIKLDGDRLYEAFQRIYDESVGRDTNNEKVEDKMRNRGRGR